LSLSQIKREKSGIDSIGAECKRSDNSFKVGSELRITENNMTLIGIDLGGTKVASAVFTENGSIIEKDITFLGNRKGADVGELITEKICELLDSGGHEGTEIKSVGISVPGISHSDSGTVWAPNIPGWDDYPLLAEVKAVCGRIPVTIDSDRACYIMGEVWQGNARECRNAIFLSVGTGIGAGILIDGEVLRGNHDIAGAIGWMALSRPFRDEYVNCGCFEHYASGEGIAKTIRAFLNEDITYSGDLRKIPVEKITSHEVFSAFEQGDHLAATVIRQCVEFWGMAVANLVSLFNPEKIILGGGVFGPAINLIPAIRKEALRWAQPVSISQVSIEASALAGDAGIYGAGFLALKNCQD
jgi:glucokinase